MATYGGWRSGAVVSRQPSSASNSSSVTNRAFMRLQQSGKCPDPRRDPAGTHSGTLRRGGRLEGDRPASVPRNTTTSERGHGAAIVRGRVEEAIRRRYGARTLRHGRGADRTPI